jgi:alpha-amylase/alpha-mannosidase (GH57 family)
MRDSSDVLYVALLWHFHQPFYKDLVSGEYWFPWVRLHAVKDYYEMANLVIASPGVRLNFNFVPCLLQQLDDYAEATAKERVLELSLTPARDLTPSQQIGILAQFFSANWETMVDPYPRYRELLEKRGRGGGSRQWEEVRGHFSPQDFLDLQVWFNLVWFHSRRRRADPFLRDLVRKGRGFSEEEKLSLLAKQREVIAQIIPLYRALFEEGRLELTTSPFYHPILPLLCDTEVAREASPDLVLPRNRFHHPEDARAQIKAALQCHREHFGHSPSGMWPSEGAVSNETAAMAAEAGFKWIASDEEILFRSLGLPLPGIDGPRQFDHRILYSPYLFRGSEPPIAMLFRDHHLSDLIGFTYARWDPKVAAQDFLGRLHQLRCRVAGGSNEGPFLVTIILDGENAWEYYQDDGGDFLAYLYEGLARGEGLETVKISDFLHRFPPQREIPKIAAGSWINHDFRIWIGHEEDNAAWDLLAQTRNDLVFFEERSRSAPGGGEVQAREKAWQEIYIAEGSDWCWWYGDEHSSAMDEEFDNLFRKHLMNVYILTGAEIPDRLYTPLIGGKRGVTQLLRWADLIHPVLDGRVTNYFEWLPAASYCPAKAGDVMHLARPLISGIWVGFDWNAMYLRIDIQPGLRDLGEEDSMVEVHMLAPSSLRLEAKLKTSGATEKETRSGTEALPLKGFRAAVDKILEMGIPLSELGVKGGEEVRFIILVSVGGKERERWPRTSCFVTQAPCPELLSDFWQA